MDTVRAHRRTIRTLIADDEPTAREGMRLLLATDPEVQLVGECSSGREAVAGIRAAVPDLVFLDVQMPDLEGFAVLRHAGADRTPAVVFVSACEQDALRAFEVNAVDYVLKPFTNERFRAALQRAKQQVHSTWLDAALQNLTALLPERAPSRRPRHRDRLPVRSNGTVTLLPVGEIEWIDAEGDHVRVHVGKTWYRIRETMKTLEDELDGARFVRIHRSTIVNLEKIKELQRFVHGEYVVVLYNGATLKLSRGYRDRLEAHLGRAL
ncbi:MAG TPA: LytTR family DNA-binding domain-containing protein [Gemmatimonadales bacterium]|nr:LytTR family DNA-binding domain-containing protein [Gemmatimonadales bacterium]